MAKYVCIFLCLAVLISAAYCLNCYNCHSETIDACLKSKSPKSVPCGNPAPGQKQVCYYKHSYDTKKKAVSIESKCALVPANSAAGTQPAECTPPPSSDIKIEECKVCETDNCNSAPVFGTSLFTLLSLPVMYFVTKILL